MRQKDVRNVTMSARRGRAICTRGYIQIRSRHPPVKAMPKRMTTTKRGDGRE